MANKIETIDQINAEFEKKDNEIKSLINTSNKIIEAMRAQQNCIESIGNEVKKLMEKVHIMQF